MTPTEYLVQIITEYASTAGIPPEGFAGLATASDWECVVKANALVENALNAALAPQVPPEWRDWFTGRVTLDTKRRLARDLGILEARSATAVEHLARLRNRVVHDPKGFALDLKAFAAAPQNTDFVDAMAWGTSAISLRHEPLSDLNRRIALGSPRLACLMVAVTAAMQLQIRAGQLRVAGQRYPA